MERLRELALDVDKNKRGFHLLSHEYPCWQALAHISMEDVRHTFGSVWRVVSYDF